MSVTRFDGAGWPLVLVEPAVSDTQSRVRRNKRCPDCGFFTGVFCCSTTEGALYRCMNLLARRACGAYFEGPMPEPWRP